MHRLIGLRRRRLPGTGADVVPGGVEAAAHQFTGSGAHIFQGGSRARAYIFYGGADALDQFLDDLRVAVYGG